jgi:hypothetical protein
MGRLIHKNLMEMERIKRNITLHLQANYEKTIS